MKDVFTYVNYSKIIGVLKRSGREIGGVADFFKLQSQKDRVIFRHDVDRFPKKAICLAQLENEHGIRATYYFRATPKGYFPVRAVQAISNLGHEVGYHYETLSVCRDDHAKAIALFAQNLETFRRIAPCITVSMHGSPLSRYNNLELLKDIDLQQFGLIADAVLSFSGFNIIYYTDTGGSWNADDILNMRDRIPFSLPAPASHYVPFTSDEFKRLLIESPITFYINIHPERWARDNFNLLICRTRDLVANLAKRLLLWGRG